MTEYEEDKIRHLGGREMLGHPGEGGAFPRTLIRGLQRPKEILSLDSGSAAGMTSRKATI